MAETSIKISLELADKAAQKSLSDFIDRAGKGEAALGKLKSSGNSTFSEISVGIGKSIGIYDIFVGNLAANVAIEAFRSIQQAANALFQTFIVDGVKAAQDAQDSLNALNVALAQSGIYSKQTSEEFQAFATQLQNASTFEDDFILKNAALIQSLGNLDKEGLKKATTAAVNLSAALGIDLSAASTALGKAANGNTTSLQKMGISILKGRDDAETFANALKAVESRFEGAAASKINTYSGAVAQASNTFSNLTEEIGNLIVKNPAVISAIKEISTIMLEITSSIKGQNSSWIQLVGDGLSGFLTIAAFLNAMLDVTIRTVQTLFGVLQKLALPIVGLIGVFKTFNEGLDEGANYINKMTASASKNFNALGQSGDGALSNITENLLRVRAAVDKGLGSIKSGADATVEPLNNTAKAIKGISEEQKRAEDGLRSFVLELVKSGESSKATSELQLEAARAKADMELAIEQQLVNDRLLTQTDFLVRKAEIEAEYETTRMGIEDQKYIDDQIRLDEALAMKKASETEYRDANLALDAKFRATTLKGEADAKKQKVKTDEEIKAQERRDQQYRLQSTASMFGGLAALAATGGKKMFEIAKAFNLAEAITSGVLSIQNAAASAPPPFNIPAIVGASAFAAANIIRISSTKAPSFADGGIVPGSSFSGDRVSANVNSGEMILNRAQQRTLFDVANGSGGDSSRVEALLGRLIGAIEGSPVVVNIGGRTVVDTIRSELAAGRSFA